MVVKEDVRARLRALVNDAGWTQAAAARKCGMPRRTAGCILKRDAARKVKKKVGRKAHLSDRDKRRIVNHIKTTRRSGGCTAATTKADLGLDASARVISSAMTEAGYWYLVRREKTPLTEDEMALHLDFAKRHEGYSADWWKRNVHLFVDEKTFAFSSDPAEQATLAAKRIRRQKDEGYHNDCVGKGKRQSSGSKGVKVLCGFGGPPGRNCKMTLCVVYQKMSGENYAEMIKRHFVPALRAAHPDGPGTPEGWCILHDGDTSHRSGPARGALLRKRIRVFPWLSKFQSCNPIENAWTEILRKLNKSAPRGREMRAAFTERLVRAIRGVRPAYLNELADSMPRRMRAKVANKGGAVKY